MTTVSYESYRPCKQGAGQSILQCLTSHLQVHTPHTLAKSNIISADVNNNLTEFTFSISQHFLNLPRCQTPGKKWTMVAVVSIFTFRTVESPITRALSSGFSVGASLSGENLFNVLIGMEERCFDLRLCHLTVNQLPCCTGSSGTEKCTGLPELVASKTVSTALTFLLSSTKVWMHVSSSKIFSVSLTISLHLSHVNPSSPTER